MQHKDINNVGFSSEMYEHIPNAVFEIKIAQNPTNNAFFLPIFEIVKAWIGVHTTPAKLKHVKIHAIITVDMVLVPYLVAQNNGKKLDIFKYRVPQTSIDPKILLTILALTFASYIFCALINVNSRSASFYKVSLKVFSSELPRLGLPKAGTPNDDPLFESFISIQLFVFVTG